MASVPQINNFAGYSTSLGLNAQPNIDQKKYPDIYAQFVQIGNAIKGLQQYLDLYTCPIIVAITSEAIAAGAMVNLYSNGGILTARNANATSATTKAHCFALGATVTGAQGQFQTQGNNPFIGALTPGTEYYLSDATPGNILGAAPTTAGHIVQSIGLAIQDAMLFMRIAANWKQL